MFSQCCHKDSCKLGTASSLHCAQHYGATPVSSRVDLQAIELPTFKSIPAGTAKQAAESSQGQPAACKEKEPRWKPEVINTVNTSQNEEEV